MREKSLIFDRLDRIAGALGGRLLFALGISLILWASAFAGIRVGLEGYSPGVLALIRFATASAVYGLIALFQPCKSVSRKDLPGLFLLGVLGVTGYHVALNSGERTVTAGSASFLINTVPLLTLLLSSLLLGETLRRRVLIGMSMGLVGVALIAFGEGRHFKLEPGAFLVLLAALFQSFYFVSLRRMALNYTGRDLSFYILWFGTVPLLIYLPAFIKEVKTASWNATAAAIYLGVFPGAVSNYVWTVALQKVSAVRLTSLLYIVPALTLVIAWLGLHEVPRLLAIAGGLLALTGVVIGNWRSRTLPKPG